MTTRDIPWPKGTPCWVDLATTDREAAWDFYGQLFGWKITDSGEEFGHYGMAEIDGLPVAGIGQIMPGSEQPPAWTTYLATDDADTTVAAVTANGGTVMAGPMPIGDLGRLTVAQDPTGAVFGTWQAQQMIGCAVVNQPGALVWNECLTRDTGRARTFYSAVFGYTYTPVEGGFDYTTIDGEGPGGTVGGIGELDASLPPEVPAFWLAYFQVQDADAVAEQATSRGGQVRMGPFDTPYGRTVILTDPQGAAFAIIAPPAAG